MKVRIIDCNYSFRKQVVGKTYEATCLGNHYQVEIDHVHGLKRENPVGTIWNFSTDMVEVVGDDPIKFVSEKDIGRIAYSKDGKYKIEVLGIIDSNYVDAKLIEARDEILGVNVRFKIVKGNEPMFWENTGNSKKKVKKKQRPPVLEQKKVYILYSDGSKHLTKHAIVVYIDTERRQVNITNKIPQEGIDIRQNVTLRFDQLQAIRIKSPDQDVTLSFTGDAIKQKTEIFGKEQPLITTY